MQHVAHRRSDEVHELRAALRRLSQAIRALGKRKGDKTLFEGNPVKDQECFEAWRELNYAQIEADDALRETSVSSAPKED